MTQVATTSGGAMTAKSLFSSEAVKAKFTELLGKKAQGFITSVLQIVSSNSLLTIADPKTIYAAAATAATMDLPINQNLGFAYIVPYKGQAQFQMGWKGYVQLAQRTGQFKTIHATEIYENQIERVDYMTGEVVLKSVEPSGKVIGYLAYFKLLNGFEKSFYMSRQQMEVHAKKYSQSFKKGYGVWADGEDGFNAMGKKTVLKLLLNRFAPLAIEMQRAVTLDQAVIKDEKGEDFVYIDNSEPDVNKEVERFTMLASECNDLAKLNEYYVACTDEIKALVNDVYESNRERIVSTEG